MAFRLVLLAVLLALAVPSSAVAAVTIKAGGPKHREVLYPKTFRIKGKTGTYRGPVKIQMDEFPFEGTYTDVGTVETNSKGEYVFPKVGPTRNARVRVVAGPETSKNLSLFVHPGVKIKYRTSGGTKVKIAFTYNGHPGFAPPENSFFVYIIKNDKEPARRLGGKRKLTQVGDGRWQYAQTTDLPSSRNRYSYFLVFCTRRLAELGYGRAYRVDRNCGKKSFVLGDGS
jgi:hypothetical protein